MEEQFDPLQKVELAMFRAEHQKRYQVMISYVKEEVGEGIEYRNDVVRVVVSDRGAYYELTDLPEEFCGAVGENLERHFVAPGEAVSVLTRAFEATKIVTSENTRQFSIIALYSRRGLMDRKNCYVYEFRPSVPSVGSPPAPLTVGAFQPDVMPLFYKIRMDTDFTQDVLSIPRGIVFCMANTGDRHLLIRIALKNGEVVDLANQPFTTTAQ